MMINNHITVRVDQFQHILSTVIDHSIAHQPHETKIYQLILEGEGLFCYYWGEVWSAPLGRSQEDLEYVKTSVVQTKPDY